MQQEEPKKPQSVTEYFNTTKERSDHFQVIVNEQITEGKSLLEIIEYMQTVEKVTQDELCGFLFSLGMLCGRLSMGNEKKSDIILLN